MLVGLNGGECYEYTLSLDEAGDFISLELQVSDHDPGSDNYNFALLHDQMKPVYEAAMNSKPFSTDVKYSYYYSEDSVRDKGELVHIFNGSSLDYLNDPESFEAFLDLIGSSDFDSAFDSDIDFEALFERDFINGLHDYFHNDRQILDEDERAVLLDAFGCHIPYVKFYLNPNETGRFYIEEKPAFLKSTSISDFEDSEVTGFTKAPAPRLIAMLDAIERAMFVGHIQFKPRRGQNQSVTC